MNDSNGQPLCIGSGFFVSDDIVATNAHVIQGAGSGSAKLVGQKQTFQVLGTLAVDLHADLALLRVSGKAPTLKLSRGAAPVVGDNVYVIGNPLGLEGTFSEGIVSGVRATGTDSVIQMTAPISPGSSGGPVLDAAGEVIGVAVATFKEGQNLNLAVPVAYLERMLDAHPASMAPLQPNSPRSKLSTSIIDGLGTRAEEGVIATDFRMDRDLDFSYRIRLTNRLPVAVSKITVVVIFFDGTGKMLDFDQWTWSEAIPSGLTKDASGLMSGRDVYRAISETLHNGHYIYRTELRVVGFKTEDAQY